jgi:protein TonB
MAADAIERRRQTGRRAGHFFDDRRATLSTGEIMPRVTGPFPGNNPVTTTDRMALAVFFAAVLHAMIILGITFGADVLAPPEGPLPSLDITIATRNTPPPEQAEYLAQTSQDGGGNVAVKVRPQQSLPPQAPSVSTEPPAPSSTQVLTAKLSSSKIEQDTTPVSESVPKDLSASELMERSMEMINLSEQVSESLQTYAKQPRQVFVSARTQEFKYANYMIEWVKKVERVGNLNYPDAARRDGISGKLLLDVALNPDGTVRNISVLRPSGQPLLDEAAVRIVNLAGPFLPFPPEIRKEADVLHITRTWEFSTAHHLQSR